MFGDVQTLGGQRQGLDRVRVLQGDAALDLMAQGRQQPVALAGAPMEMANGPQMTEIIGVLAGRIAPQGPAAWQPPPQPECQRQHQRQNEGPESLPQPYWQRRDIDSTYEPYRSPGSQVGQQPGVVKMVQVLVVPQSKLGKHGDGAAAHPETQQGFAGLVAGGGFQYLRRLAGGIVYRQGV